MKPSLSSRFIAATVLVAAALGAASAAQARPDFQVSIGLPGLPVFVPPPVYVQAQPVFDPPRPVYGAPPAVSYQRPWPPSYQPDFERGRDWRQAEWQRRDWERREWQRREWERREWERREWIQHHDRFPAQGRGRD